MQQKLVMAACRTVRHAVGGVLLAMHPVAWAKFLQMRGNQEQVYIVVATWSDKGTCLEVWVTAFVHTFSPVEGHQNKGETPGELPPLECWQLPSVVCLMPLFVAANPCPSYGHWFHAETVTVFGCFVVAVVGLSLCALLLLCSQLCDSLL